MKTLILCVAIITSQIALANRYECTVLFFENKGSSNWVIGEAVLDSSNNEIFSKKIDLIAQDGKAARFEFFFETHQVATSFGQTSRNTTKVVSPFDGSFLFHSDLTGKTDISTDSIMNLVEPHIMIGSKNALVGYNVNYIINKTNRILNYQGRTVNSISASCLRF